jgi:hypothetical protein
MVKNEVNKHGRGENGQVEKGCGADQEVSRGGGGGSAEDRQTNCEVSA